MCPISSEEKRVIGKLIINGKRTDSELVAHVVSAKKSMHDELVISWNTQPSLATPITLIETCRKTFYTNLALAIAFSAANEVEVMGQPFTVATQSSLSKLEGEIYNQLERLYWPHLSSSLSEHNQMIEKTIQSRLKLARAITVGLSKNEEHQKISAKLLNKIKEEKIPGASFSNG